MFTVTPTEGDELVQSFVIQLDYFTFIDEFDNSLEYIISWAYNYNTDDPETTYNALI